MQQKICVECTWERQQDAPLSH